MQVIYAAKLGVECWKQKWVDLQYIWRRTEENRAQGLKIVKKKRVPTYCGSIHANWGYEKQYMMLVGYKDPELHLKKFTNNYYHYMAKNRTGQARTEHKASKLFFLRKQM